MSQLIKFYIMVIIVELPMFAVLDKVMIKQGSSYYWGLSQRIPNVLDNALVNTIGKNKRVNLPERGQINTSKELLRCRDRWRELELLRCSLRTGD